jgi:hypothetical protein
MPDRPTAGAVELRAAPLDAPAPTIDGRRLRGVIPYGVESRDLGGWREVMQPGCLSRADTGDRRGDRAGRRRVKRACLAPLN